MKKNKERLQRESVIENEMIELLQTVKIIAPNTNNTLGFDLDGYFHIKCGYGNTLKKYKRFANAINWLMLND